MVLAAPAMAAEPVPAVTVAVAVPASSLYGQKARQKKGEKPAQNGGQSQRRANKMVAQKASAVADKILEKMC